MVINVFKCVCGHYNYQHKASPMNRLQHWIIMDFPIGDGPCEICDCKEMRMNRG